MIHNGPHVQLLVIGVARQHLFSFWLDGESRRAAKLALGRATQGEGGIRWTTAARLSKIIDAYAMIRSGFTPAHFCSDAVVFREVFDSRASAVSDGYERQTPADSEEVSH